jgi:SAM-dependent methyltransferase
MLNIAAIFDREADKWDAEHGPKSQRAAEFQSRSRYLRAICGELGNPRALDLGCGTGQQLLDLADVIGSGVGLDISPGMIARARGNAARSIRPEDFEFLIGDTGAAKPEEIGRFELVLFIGSLEHAPDPSTPLAAASRLLAQDGKLVVIMPHPWNPGVLLMRLSGTARRGAPYRHLTPRQLVRLAARQGLRLESVRGLPFHPSARASGGMHSERPFVAGAYGVSFTTPLP